MEVLQNPTCKGIPRTLDINFFSNLVSALRKDFNFQPPNCYFFEYRKLLKKACQFAATYFSTTQKMNMFIA
jgi:hypothetical protein